MSQPLQLQYGINLHADHVYENYTPLQYVGAYPDPLSSDLRVRLAEYAGVTPAMVLCGNGSDELIDLYIRVQLLLDADTQIVIAPPTYFQYQSYAHRSGADLITMPHDRMQLTPSNLARANADPAHAIIMLDNPSNPAGDLLPRQQILDLLEAGYRVFCDEAYYEFCGSSMVDLIALYPSQLVVSRTLSKIAAMAGARLGYVLADPEVIAQLIEHKMLFNVNAEAQARGLFALDHMPAFQLAIGSLKGAKQHVVEALKPLDSYQVLASLDLFVIFKHHHIPSVDLHRRLREHDIETFLFEDFKGQSVIRATSGRLADLDRLIAVLSTLA